MVGGVGFAGMKYINLEATDQPDNTTRNRHSKDKEYSSCHNPTVGRSGFLYPLGA